MPRLYHYTKGLWLPSILGSGEIRPSPVEDKNERRIVWLSTNPEWEITVSPFGGKEWMHIHGGGLVRIAISDKLPVKNWSTLRFESKMHPVIADSLEEVAREAGANPDEWYGTFRSIPQSYWLSIECLNWETQTWEPVEELVTT